MKVSLSKFFDVERAGFIVDPSNNRHVWGYFKIDAPKRPASYSPFHYHQDKEIFVFWGRYGKSLSFKRYNSGSQFNVMVNRKFEKYKEVKLETILARWPEFNNQVEMFLIHKALAGK